MSSLRMETWRGGKRSQVFADTAHSLPPRLPGEALSFIWASSREGFSSPNTGLLCMLEKHSNKYATPLARRAVLRIIICKSINVVIPYFKMPVSKISLERKESITKVSLDHPEKHMEGRNYSSLSFVINARNTCKGILFKEQILKPEGMS